MKIEPFSTLDDVPLNITPDELGRFYGSPLTRCKNRIGLEEFQYKDRVFRFGANGVLNEVTIEAEYIKLGGVSFPFTHLAEFIEVNDPHSFNKVGFIVSPTYGIAFDPEYRPWVTVLTTTGLEGWEKL